MEVTHVSVFHSRLARFDLVRIWVRFVHPFVLKTVSSCVFHCLIAHVFERSGQDAEDFVRLVDGLVVWRLAWRFRVVRSLVHVVFLAIILIEHVLEDLGGELLGCHFSVLEMMLMVG